MHHIALLFLALLWAVAAGVEEVAHEVAGRHLKGEKCTARSGDLCIKSFGVPIHVDGDFEFWRGQGDVGRVGQCDSLQRMRPVKLNTKEKRFCGRVDGMVHDLIAPRFAKELIKEAGFRSGQCKRYPWGSPVAHTVKMDVIGGVGEVTGGGDDCFCKQDDCYCPCDCGESGAVELEEKQVTMTSDVKKYDRKKKREQKKRERKKKRRNRNKRRNESTNPFNS